MFRRPNIGNNDQLAGAGLTWTIVTPFEELWVHYEGKVLWLEEPEQMTGPQGGVHEQPVRRRRSPPDLYGPGTRGGFVWDDGAMHYCDDVEISTETRGADHYHDRISATLRSSRSDREWRFSGEVIDLIPLRNRRKTPDGEWLQTRISEAYTRWTMSAGEHAGRVGYGMSEYLDQIVDGRPVGLDE